MAELAMGRHPMQVVCSSPNEPCGFWKLPSMTSWKCARCFSERCAPHSAWEPSPSASRFQIWVHLQVPLPIIGQTVIANIQSKDQRRLRTAVLDLEQKAAMKTAYFHTRVGEHFRLLLGCMHVQLALCTRAETHRAGCFVSEVAKL